MTTRELNTLAAEVRATVVAMSHAGQAPHLGSALSCVEILIAAYFLALRIDPARPDDPTLDKLLFSKGHAAAAWYAVLARRGYFDPQLLRTYAKDGSSLPEQPHPGSVPGVDVGTGSLGHGLPIACGLAVAARLLKSPSRTLVVMSDGECNEGSVWEAAMFAAHQKLGSLTAVIDFNGWQATGRTSEVTALDPLSDKFAAFGWEPVEVDGHDIKALAQAMTFGGAKPRVIIARTVKGKGVSFMEDDNNWHYRVPTAEEVAAAHRELLAA